MTNTPSTKQIVSLFKASISQGMGDLETMLAGLRFRILKPSEKLNPKARPPAYRSQILRDQLKKEFGARRTSLWGGTALRGDFDPKTKSHLIEFFKAVNTLPSDVKILTLAFASCAKLYAEKVNALYPEILLPEIASVQCQLLHALSVPSEGKVQQGLVYALLTVFCKYAAPSRTVHTKLTHAGDTQSGHIGDIQILEKNIPIAVYEIKAFSLDQSGVDRLLPTHGQHNYPLFILATDFKPLQIKHTLCSLTNTFGICLGDYCLSTFSEICIVTGKSAAFLLAEIIEIYNEEFCEKIENDKSIKIQVSKH